MTKNRFVLVCVALIGVALTVGSCKGYGKDKDKDKGCGACTACSGCGGCKGCGACSGCGACEGCGGCGGCGPGDPGNEADRAMAKKLFGEYGRWRRVNNELFKSRGHNNMMVTDYVNALADPVFTRGSGNHAPGAALAKVGMKGGKVKKIWIMRKQSAGYDSGNGDWLYAQFTASGKLESAGPMDSCVNCHDDAKNDYVFGYPAKHK